MSDRQTPCVLGLPLDQAIARLRACADYTQDWEIRQTAPDRRRARPATLRVVRARDGVLTVAAFFDTIGENEACDCPKE